MARLGNPGENMRAAPLPEPPFSGRMDRLRLRHLRLLDLVARHGSLSAAAQALGISQPGATKLLHEVEAAFECQLIERTAKGGQLNPAGRHTLDRMRIALQVLGTAHAAVAAQPELPLIRLGILPLVGINALCHVVAALQANNSLPRIQIHQDTVEGLLQALSDGRVDCAVGALDGEAPTGQFRHFKVTPLWEESLVIVAAADHPLARKRKVSLGMLLEHDWVMMPVGSSNRRTLESLFQQAGVVPPLARIETESFHIGLSLVSGSRMLSAVPVSAYRHFQTRLCALPVDRRFAARTLVFVTLADMPNLAAVELIEQQFQHYARRSQGVEPDELATKPHHSGAGLERSGSLHRKRSAAKAPSGG